MDIHGFPKSYDLLTIHSTWTGSKCTRGGLRNFGDVCSKHATLLGCIFGFVWKIERVSATDSTGESLRSHWSGHWWIKQNIFFRNQQSMLTHTHMIFPIRIHNRFVQEGNFSRLTFCSKSFKKLVATSFSACCESRPREKTNKHHVHVGIKWNIFPVAMVTLR